MDEHYKKWIRNRRFNYWSAWVALIITLALIPLLFLNIGIVAAFIELCGIAYFIFEMDQLLKEDNATPEWYRIIYFTVFGLYFIASLVSVFLNAWYLAYALFILAGPYLCFRTYYVFNRGVRNKLLTLLGGNIAMVIGFAISIGFFVFNYAYFWIVVAVMAVVYEIFLLIVKICLQFGNTNRTI